jgi:AcrR family transcriptional regulator
MSTSAARVADVIHVRSLDPQPSKRVRVVDGALACIADQGVKKTTVEDIASTAGISRATLYRAFPGGREAVLQAVVETELARLFSSLAVAMGSATTLEDVLVSGIQRCAAELTSSAALAAVLQDDPASIMRHVTFEGMDHTIFVASTFAEPFFGRWLEPDQARRAAELAVRALIAYLVDPDPTLVLSQEASVRRLVRRFILPGVEALRAVDQAE